MPASYVATFRNLNFSLTPVVERKRAADGQITIEAQAAIAAGSFKSPGEFTVRVYRDDRRPPLWRARLAGTDGRLPIGRNESDKAKRDVGKFFDSQVTEWKEE